MESFIQFCQRLSPISETTKTQLISYTPEIKSFKKGEVILRENTYCNHFYFITQGLAKMCFTSEDKEFIMRFFPENILFTNIDSFTRQKPSKYTFIAIEDTTLFKIPIHYFEELCTQHHSLETFYRKFMTLANSNMMERISEMLEEDAKARYENFIKKSPMLLQRISLGDLASYLGITQVSLSRIRANK